ncbi:hypothetical protein HETIRDRAFT_120129 [Heterobasidion irregulare TC 32-1]|uniref:Uncharacterized protein n=1 Tax=Heterobasidion irregulare (strain TC 32-1) TaxID=747525 RepID=W4JXT1_HETIT|nr:uncharacterized protein HETIRDRAFT_120129 [Heterobasidion irregulare TC 32-1]ETW78269.1 hypothetical protein HETIRDRAFT_120129 [Heterobasidion irregulare TC 32-1]
MPDPEDKGPIPRHVQKQRKLLWEGRRVVSQKLFILRAPTYRARELGRLMRSYGGLMQSSGAMQVFLCMYKEAQGKNNYPPVKREVLEFTRPTNRSASKRMTQSASKRMTTTTTEVLDNNKRMVTIELYSTKASTPQGNMSDKSRHRVGGELTLLQISGDPYIEISSEVMQGHARILSCETKWWTLGQGASDRGNFKGSDEGPDNSGDEGDEC